MAEFPNLTITSAGLEMIAQSQLGEQLIFTKMQMGDGQITTQPLESLTALISSKMDLNINSQAPVEGHPNQWQVSSLIQPSQVTANFWFREIGLFAKVGDTGQERLYCYANAGSKSDYLSAENIGDDGRIDIAVTVGNTANVTAALVSGIYVTHDDLTAHNTSDSAHENRFKKYLPLAGGTVTGLLQLAQTLMTNLSTNIPANDNSGKLVPSAWVQNLLAALATNTAVTWDGDNFSCPALDIHGLMAQNGYISFGKLFGGFILQWGIATPIIGADGVCVLPVAFPTAIINVIICAGYTAGSGTIGYVCANPASLQTFVYRENAGLSPNYIAIGR